MILCLTGRQDTRSAVQALRCHLEIVDLSTLPLLETRYTEFLSLVCDKFEMDHAAYAGIEPAAGSIHGHVTYTGVWKSHHTEQDFHLIDPTLHLVQRSIVSVDWSRLEASTNFQKIMRDAKDFGIPNQGIAIPIRGPNGEIGLLNASRDCSRREWRMLIRHVIGDLQSLAVRIHDSVMSSDPLRQALHNPALSKREAEILQWFAAGKTQDDIGDLLSISRRTGEVHLRSSLHKLMALNTGQAVRRAITAGLIVPC